MRVGNRGNVLITGAAHRVGRAIATGLAQIGWATLIHYHRSGKEADSLVAEIAASGGRAAAVRGDLRDVSALPQLISDCSMRFGPLHALVNNAAVFEFDRGRDYEPETWQKHLDVNLRAPLVLSQLLFKQLPDDRVGCVINLLDQKVFNLNPDFFSYTVSKVALEGMTRMLALEFAPRMRVCAIAPGLTMVSGDQTDENFARAHRITPLGRASTPDDIAGAVAYLLDAPAVTGSTLIVDGGQHLFPLKRDVMFAVDEDDLSD